jgi:hypothetical protein
MTASEQGFYNAFISGASLNVEAVKIGLVNGSEEVINGSYVLQQVDMQDIAAYGSGPLMSSASALGPAGIIVIVSASFRSSGIIALLILNIPCNWRFNIMSMSHLKYPF